MTDKYQKLLDDWPHHIEYAKPSYLEVLVLFTIAENDGVRLVPLWRKIEGHSVSKVALAISKLIRRGLVQIQDGVYSLTERGKFAVSSDANE